MKINNIQNQENNDLILNGNIMKRLPNGKRNNPFLIETFKKNPINPKNPHKSFASIPLVFEEVDTTYNPKENHQFLTEFFSSFGIKNRKDLNDIFYRFYPTLPFNTRSIQYEQIIDAISSLTENSLNKVQNDSTFIYKESCHLSIFRMILNIKIQQLQTETDYLKHKFQFEKNMIDSGTPLETEFKHENQAIIIDKKKRFRRTSNDIDKNFKCPEKMCNKAYGYF